MRQRHLVQVLAGVLASTIPTGLHVVVTLATAGPATATAAATATATAAVAAIVTAAAAAAAARSAVPIATSPACSRWQCAGLPSGLDCPNSITSSTRR